MFLSRQKKIIKNCGYILYLFVVISIGLELIIRVLGIAPPLPSQFSKNISDLYLSHRPRPLSTVSGEVPSGEFSFDYSHNSLGFRDIEHSINKPENTFRILGLGDSFTYGSGAEFKDTYLFQLEKMLNNREGDHPQIEIIKAGIPRYFPKTERLLLEYYGKQFKPNLIIVGFLPNDIIDTALGPEFIKVNRSGYLTSLVADEISGIERFFFLHSHISRIIIKKYVEREIHRNYPIHWDEVYQPDGFHEKDWIKVEDEYRELLSLANSIDARLVILHIPMKGPWDPHDSYPAKRLARWCKSHNAYFVNALPMLKKAGDWKYTYYQKDGHCRPAGYKVIAQVLFDKLTKNRLVP